MYRNILVAVDGSEHSVRALKQAEQLARALDSRLILVHAFATADIAGHSDHSSLLAGRRAKGQEVLDAARATLEDAARVEQEVLSADPDAEAILAAAKTHRADLVVMGSRGLGTLKGLLLGSVSQKVSHLASCPVLLVR